MEENESSPRTRPLGVSIISALFWIFGLLFLLGAVAGWVGPLMQTAGTLGVALILLLVLFSLVAIAVGYGLWKLKGLALWIAILLIILDVVYRLSIVSLGTSEHPDETSAIINVIIMTAEVIIAVYLVLNREAFEAV